MKMKQIFLLINCLLISFSCAKARSAGFEMIRGGEYTPPNGKQVIIEDPYWGKYETTIAEWSFLVKSELPNFDLNEIIKAKSNEPAAKGATESDLSPNFPATNMTWIEAIAYCNWKSKKDGLSPAYSIDAPIPYSPDSADYETAQAPVVKLNRSANGYRLPTSAEWEFAAKGGLSGIKKTWWKDIKLTDFGFFLENSSGRLRQVGQLKANPAGLFDIIGLTEEWCWDSYSESNSDEAKSGQMKVVRGGSVINSSTKPFSIIENGVVMSGYEAPDFFSHTAFLPGYYRGGAVGFRIVRPAGRPK